MVRVYSGVEMYRRYEAPHHPAAMVQHALRLGIVADSGALEGSTDYTTVVLLHGYGWQSSEFASQPFRSVTDQRTLNVL